MRTSTNLIFRISTVEVINYYWQNGLYEQWTKGNCSCKVERCNGIIQQSQLISIIIIYGLYVNTPCGENPSCLHTTLASLLSQKASQMVPHVPLVHTSILPDLAMLEPLSWTAPSMQRSVQKQWMIWLHAAMSCHYTFTVETCSISCITCRACSSKVEATLRYTGSGSKWPIAWYWGNSQYFIRQNRGSEITWDC